jgi:WD40 repeat protein
LDATTGNILMNTAMGLEFPGGGQVVYSPDGKYLASAAGQAARIWNAATGETIFTLEAKDTDGIAYSPDGTRLATAGRDGTARIWDAARGTALTEPLVHAGYINSAAFSPDGTRLVTVSSDPTAQTWDATTGKPVVVPSPHPDAVLAAAWSPDGRELLTVDGNTASLWTIATAPGSLADWQARARCMPFQVIDNVVVPSEPMLTACVSPAAIADPPATR